MYMWYLIQHLAPINMSWFHDAFIYIVRLEKEMGFVDLPVLWFVIIAKSGPMFCHPFACRYLSIIMCQSISRLTTQLHQVPLLAVISVIDQMISFKVAGEVLRNLAAHGVLKFWSLLFIIAFYWRHQFRAICCCLPAPQYLTTGTLMTEK